MDSLRKAILFTPIEMFICLFPNIFPLPPHGGPVSDLWCCCGRPSQVSAVMSCRTRVAEHSLITPLFCGGDVSLHGGGERFSHLQLCFDQSCFYFFGVPEPPCRKADLLQVLCPHENLPVSEPMSPALAGSFTTEPPKKRQMKYFLTSSYLGIFQRAPKTSQGMILTSLQLGILAHIITWVPLANPLEESRATHSSILARRIPWTEEPGGLQSLGSQRAGHN